MADAFVRLERIGSGYALLGGGRGDSPFNLIHTLIGGNGSEFSLNTGFSWENTEAMIVGWSGNDTGTYPQEIYMLKDTDIGDWRIVWKSDGQVGPDAFVDILYVSKTLITRGQESLID